MKENSLVPQQQNCLKPFCAEGLREISALLKDRNFIPRLAFSEEKSKGEKGAAAGYRTGSVSFQSFSTYFST